MGVVVVEEAVDGRLEVGDGSEDAAFEAAFGEGCEEPLNRMEPEPEAGVKPKVQRGWRVVLAIREGRVLSRTSPRTARRRSAPASATSKSWTCRSRMIAWVPSPSALSNTICACQTCFCGVLRSLTRPPSRSRSEARPKAKCRFSCPRLAHPEFRRESQSGF